MIDAVTEYRKAWRAKMAEVDSCIATNAEQEELVDKPEIDKGIVRVSGPFTVEAVRVKRCLVERAKRSKRHTTIASNLRLRASAIKLFSSGRKF
jgi:hypothetical protein